MEISLEYYVYLCLAGVIGGVLAGLYGIGGGLIYTFILPTFFAFFPKYQLGSAFVIANSFVGVFFAALSSAIKVHKDGDLPYRPVVIGGFFALVSSLLVNQFVVNQSWYNLFYFRIVVIALILGMVINIFYKTTDKKIRQENKSDMPLVGFCGGIIAALSGFGGGVIMVPMMINLGVFELKKAKNISLGIIVFVSGAIVIRSLFNQSIPSLSIGYILPKICLPMVIGTILGGPIGVKIGKRLSDKVLLNSYLTLLLFLMLYYTVLLIQ